MSDKKCRGVTPTGAPCGAVIVQANGWCSAHDPAREKERKRAAARANLTGRDPELAEIRLGLKNLVAAADRPDADLDRVHCHITLARARLYAAKVESEIMRHGREVEELEDYAADLEERFEELKNGHADERRSRARL